MSTSGQRVWAPTFANASRTGRENNYEVTTQIEKQLSRGWQVFMGVEAEVANGGKEVEWSVEGGISRKLNDSWSLMLGRVHGFGERSSVRYFYLGFGWNCR
jgi:hypothetical protein